MTKRRGVTLIELLVTISLLGIAASVANLAVKRVEKPNPKDPRTIIGDSLPVAVREARAITVAIPTDSGLRIATLRPDGSIVADSLLRIERLIGIKADTIRPYDRR